MKGFYYFKPFNAIYWFDSDQDLEYEFDQNWLENGIIICSADFDEERNVLL